jgi:glucarate dehydratase
VPNLALSADAHYHHLVDDVIEGGKLPYENGTIKVPEEPGLGVRFDHEKLERYAELYKELGGIPATGTQGNPITTR